ncbi:MAG: ChaN family lipoprotein [Crocinitomicaceae bacterium]
MNYFFTLLFYIIFLNCVFSQDKKAFIIYSKDGKKTSFRKLVDKAKSSDCILFGEYHDNPIVHWLQLELTNEILSTNLVLGFEMFESDQQRILDLYVSGKMDEKEFIDSCRLWPNYETDYKPLLDLAKKNNLSCIASNVKRKYASLLFKKGRAALDTLSEKEKKLFAPLDFKIDSTLSQYREIRKMGGHEMGGNMMESQAFKDATMAMHILKYLELNFQVLHFNGAFHSDYYQGILWYVQQTQTEKKKKFMTISTVSQNNIGKLDQENLNKADFIICVPENMTKTH